MITRVSPSGLHVPRHLLPGGQFLDDLLATHDVFKQFGKIRRSVLRSVVPWVKVLRLKGSVDRSLFGRRLCLTSLVADFGLAKKVFHLADVPEIGTVASTTQHFDGYRLGFLRRCEILLLHLPLQCLQQLVICVVVEVEGILDSEASRKTRVYILLVLPKISGSRLGSD
jgi:hypothetical protein